MQFNKIKLKDIADINMGQSPSGSSYNNNGRGIPFLQGNKTFGFLYPTIDTWTTEPKKIGKKNSVLMSVRAPVGDLNIANKDICIGRGLCSIEMKNGNNQYLYYLLKNSIKKIKMKSTGTVFDSINRKELENIEILDFDKSQQKKISKVLFDIDKKIELNIQTNDNLSEQLQLIYDEWFGKYETDNLPDGWKVEKLKNIATLSQGVQVPIDKQIYEEKSGYTRFIRIVDITQENDKDIRYIEDTERGKVEENEIFMIRYGTPGILSWNYKGIIANNLFKITPKMNCISSNFLYSYFNNNKFQRYIRGNATSSTMPAINFSTLNDRDIIIPTTDLIEKFNNISETIRLKQLSISNQNKTLSNLKDILLPKLMNGEIDIDKIEI